MRPRSRTEGGKALRSWDVSGTPRRSAQYPETEGQYPVYMDYEGYPLANTIVMCGASNWPPSLGALKAAACERNESPRRVRRLDAYSNYATSLMLKAP